MMFFPIAKAKETDKVCFKLEDITNVNETFDLILVIDVIEHLENYFLFLDTISTKSKYTFFISRLICACGVYFGNKCLLSLRTESGIFTTLLKILSPIFWKKEVTG
jgi:2-polyprenyl-3-methyl-5-hydroxy-6-metoxy-1,4-benzoquinol methylase